MTLTADSARAVFDRLTRTNLPAHTPVLFDTGCVLGAASPVCWPRECSLNTPERYRLVDEDGLEHLFKGPSLVRESQLAAVTSVSSMT